MSLLLANQYPCAMSATLLIVGSIIVATAMILLNERLMNRSVQKSPPFPSDKKTRFDESLFREDKLFDSAFDRSDFGSLLSDEKLKVKKDTKANPLVATIIFLAILMGVLMLLQTQ